MKAGKQKPLDKYRTLKCRLDQIISGKLDINKLISAVNRTNSLVTVSYLFIRLFILYKFDKKDKIPIINKNFILLAMKVVSKKSRGGPKGKDSDLYNELILFYNTEFGKLVNYEKIDKSNLSGVIDYCITDMVTNIENNIKCHFINHLRKFINQIFKQEHNAILDELKGKEKAKKKSELNRELNKLKKSLIENTQECDKKYHKWLKTNRYKILPSKYDTSYYKDISKNPQKYIPYMITMNKILEDKSLKQFQFFPLRTDITAKYMPLDTKAIIEIMIENDKVKYLENVEIYKVEIWSTYFNLSNNIFKSIKNYTFDYSISTDGYSVSIRYLHNSLIESEKQKKQARKDASKKAKARYKGKTNKEIKALKEAALIEKQKSAEKIKEIKKKQREIQKEKEKEEFDKLSKEDQKKIKMAKKKEKYSEFPYINDLVKDDLEELKKAKKVYIDPGKRSLFYMIDDNNKILNYTNRTRISQTKRLKYAKLRENYKKRRKVQQVEATLSTYNSKTCKYVKFQEYITKKYELNKKLFDFYNSTAYFKKLNWFSYLNTKRSEAKLLNLITKIYGDDIVIIIGDWSYGKQMRNFMSTPNLGLKRLLASKFTVYEVDEFRTSCLHYKSEEICKNLYLPDAKQKYRKMHSILTYQMETQRLGCINRDKNGVKNIRKCVQYFLKTGNRLAKFSRGVKWEDLTLDDNGSTDKKENRDKPQTVVKLSQCPKTLQYSIKHKA